MIGRNCHISQNVTFGGGGGPEGVPTVGDDCSFGAGAVILGGIHIGNNVQVGANAVVITDLPDNSVAVGIPAKVIKIKQPGEKTR